MIPQSRTSILARRTDALVALGATLVVLASYAVTRFAILSNLGGDNDSLLRLVQVRDLLGGQNWFDLHQYRMGPEGGFVMHWSRLVDAPIAAIMLLVPVLGGSAALAEAVAQIVWPSLLFFGALFFILRAARIFGGEQAVLPAAAIGGSALYFVGVFAPGSLDHHNVQLTLALAGLYLLLVAPGSGTAALFSGVCSALMLAIGMETAPYVATLGLCVAGLFLFAGDGEIRVARNFGLGFAGVSGLVFFATIGPADWWQVQCDAFSVAHFALAALAGLGLAAVASAGFVRQTITGRAIALAMLGVAVGLLAVAVFPQCLAAPYADLEPRLKTDWLDHVAEANSLFQLIAQEPATVVTRYVTPLIGIAWLVLRLRRDGWRRQDWLVGTALIIAFAVSVWQVRGATFSVALAVIPLSAWIANWRKRAENSASRGIAARTAMVWLVSANAFWTGAAIAATLAFDGKAASGASAANSSCQSIGDFAQLAAQPATTVLAISNLGSPILAYSGHRVFAGPYHRNIAGNLLALAAFTGTLAEARDIVEGQDVGLVAFCRGNAESRLLSKKAPDGLLSSLMAGAVPAWLEALPASAGKPLELYRVRLDR